VSSLVTGAGGFVGQWLVRALLASGEKVTGFTYGPPSESGILTREQRDAADWIEGDIRDQSSIQSAIDKSSPDAIYHLAGITFVPQAGADPTGAYEVNTMGVARLLSGVARARRAGKRSPRVLVVGSAEQYGPHDRSENALRESATQRPVTVYAASKAAQETIALKGFPGFGIDVIATRSFNHSGPGQERRFLLPGLIDRIKSLAQKKRRATSNREHDRRPRLPARRGCRCCVHRSGRARPTGRGVQRLEWKRLERWRAGRFGVENY
jgi:GDP-4-dehydro-6-deoxy-D-mannose reductase